MMHAAPEEKLSSVTLTALIIAGLLFTGGIVHFLPVHIPSKGTPSPVRATKTYVLDAMEIQETPWKMQLEFYDDTALYYPHTYSDRQLFTERLKEENTQIVPIVFKEEISTLVPTQTNFSITMPAGTTAADLIERSNQRRLVQQLGKASFASEMSEPLLAKYHIFSYQESRILKTGVIPARETLPDWHQTLWGPIVCEMVVDAGQVIGEIFVSKSNLSDNEETFLLQQLRQANQFESLPDGYYQIVFGP